MRATRERLQTIEETQMRFMTWQSEATHHQAAVARVRDLEPQLNKASKDVLAAGVLPCPFLLTFSSVSGAGGCCDRLPVRLHYECVCI